MGIISKLANVDKLYETGDNYELGQSIGGSSSVSNLFGAGGAPINLLQEYSGYVWKAVNIRSEDLAAQDFYVERKVGDKWQKDDNHDFNGVLEGEEGAYDMSELLEAHSVSMDMYGESFWYFSMGQSSSKPFAVYLLDPAYMTIYVDGNKVTGYTYSKNGDHISLDLNEIAHFRIYNPSNPFRGSGPMQKAGWFIRSSRYVTTYVNNFLENNAIPAGVIVAKEGFTDDSDWKLFKEQWQEKYSGVASAGKTGFIRSANLDFVKTGLSLGDVDFDKVKQSSRDDILAMFSVPKSKLGVYEDFNKASSVTSDQQFAKTVAKPAVQRITRRLSKKVSAWYGDQFRVGTDFTIPEDQVQKLSEADKGVGRWLTVNEVREQYGFTAIDNGDVLDNANAPASPAPPKSLGTIKIKTVKKAGFDHVMKENFRSQTEDLQVKAEQQFYQLANPILTDQRDRVLEQLKPKKLLDTNFNVQDEAKKLTDQTTQLMFDLAIAQGSLAAVFAGNADSEFQLTPTMENYISDSLAKSLLSFTQETQDKIADALETGLNNGDSISTISKEIGGIYDDVLGEKTPGYRTERLARTEVIKTSNEVTELAYKQSTAVQKKEWFANPGSCQFCAALDGSIIRLGGTFVQKGDTLEGIDGGTRLNDYEDVEHPPAHPACRCTLIPVVGD